MAKQSRLDEIAKAVNTIIPVTPELAKKRRSGIENAADQEFAVTDAFYKAAADFWEAKGKGNGQRNF